jgi:hypothetical protein
MEKFSFFVYSATLWSILSFHFYYRPLHLRRRGAHPRRCKRRAAAARNLRHNNSPTYQHRYHRFSIQ